MKRSFLMLVLIAAVVAPAGVSSAAPVPSFSMPVELLEPLTVTFSEQVRSVTADNVMLRASGATTRLPGTISCKAAGLAASCDTGPVEQVVVKPAKPLIAGQIYVGAVNPSGVSPVTDMAGVAVAAVTKIDRATISEQETSPGAVYLWRQVDTSAAYGGAYRTEHGRGASASATFTGTSITWYTRTARNQGKANVWIDGDLVSTVNNYSSTSRYKVARTFSVVGSGSHRITITVLDEKGSSRATGTWVTLDSWRAASGTVSGTTYKWDPVTHESASGDRYVRSDATGARMTFTFRGRGIDWYTATGPYQGKAKIYIDGKYRTTVDNYSASARYNVRRQFLGLSDRVHTFTILVTGYRNASAKGTRVSVDKLYVRLYSRGMFKYLGAWVDLWDYDISATNATNKMAEEGVKTLYLQTARWNSTNDFADAARAGQWLEIAHAAGLKVVGWYLPAYDQHLSKDVRRTVAIKDFRSANGHRFDALAVDIEYKGETESLSEFNTGIVQHLEQVRDEVGSGYPVGSIVPSPVGMEIRPSSWTGFPWAGIGKRSDVVLPMAYWSYRTDCATNPSHCPYQYGRDNVKKAKSYTGVPVHVIGGIGNAVSSGEVSDFVRGAKAAGTYGGSLYDYRTTAASFWAPLRGFNSLG